MPLTASADGKTLRLAAGEPFVIQLSVDTVEPLNTRSFVITFYDATRRQIDKIDGILNGDVFEFIRDGSMSEALYGKEGTRVEISERLQKGRLVICSSSLTVDLSANGVSTFGSVISRTAILIVAQNTEGGIPVTAASIVPYGGVIATPKAVMNFTSPANAAYTGAML